MIETFYLLNLCKLHIIVNRAVWDDYIKWDTLEDYAADVRRAVRLNKTLVSYHTSLSYLRSAEAEAEYVVMASLHTSNTILNTFGVYPLANHALADRSILSVDCGYRSSPFC